MLNRRELLTGMSGLALSGFSKGRRERAGSAGQASASSRETGRDRAPQDPTFMYVGSFTSPARGDGEGLGVYRMDRVSGAWTLVQLLKDLVNPSFLALDRSARFLYSSHGDGTEATAYRVNQETGHLTVLNQQPAGGENGAHLAIDGTGRFLVIANYNSGTVSVLPIERDGSLGPQSDLVTLAGKPGPHRTQQASSHPHHVPFDRTGRVLVVPDKGFDRVFVFRLDTTSGKLVAGDPPSVESRSGAAPRHVDFHPSRPYAYVINELDSTMTTYEYEPEKGVLRPLQVHTTLPSTYTGNNTGAEVVVSPDGRFVYGSNRGHDSIAIFAVDQATGLLTPVGWEATQGQTPRFFCLDPSGTHLYAANQTSGTIVMFRVDRATGKLAATGQRVKVRSPSTIVFR